MFVQRATFAQRKLSCDGKWFNGSWCCYSKQQMIRERTRVGTSLNICASELAYNRICCKHCASNVIFLRNAFCAAKCLCL